MGFFSDFGQGVSSVITGIATGASTLLGGVGGVVTSTVQAASGVINTPGGSSALSVLGGIVGGPAGIALASLGQGASNASRKGPGWTEPMSDSIFNFYKLSNGLYLRNPDSSRVFNWGKFILVVIAPITLIALFWKRIKRLIS